MINVTDIQQELRTIEFLRRAINRNISLIRDADEPKFIAMQASVEEDRPDVLVALTVAWRTDGSGVQGIEAFTFTPHDDAADIHRIAVEAWYKLHRAMGAVARSV